VLEHGPSHDCIAYPYSVCLGRCGDDVVARPQFQFENKSKGQSSSICRLHKSNDSLEPKSSLRLVPNRGLGNVPEVRPSCLTKGLALAQRQCRLPVLQLYALLAATTIGRSYESSCASPRPFQSSVSSTEAGPAICVSSHSWIGNQKGLLIGCTPILDVMLCAQDGIRTSVSSESLS
jgi:hypothetical protein